MERVRTIPRKKMRGKLKSINFRCKDDSWADFVMKEVIKSIPKNKMEKYFISKDNDSYMRMFYKIIVYGHPVMSVQQRK